MKKRWDKPTCPSTVFFAPDPADPTCSNCQRSSSPPASLPLKARLLNFLEDRPGVPFEPEELVSEFGGNREVIRKTLERLWRSGLIQFEERVKQAGKGTRKYRVYLVTEVVRSSESSQSKPFSSGQPNSEAQDSNRLSSAKTEPVLSSEPAPAKNLEAQDKTNSGTPAQNFDFQQDIFSAQPESRSSEPRLVLLPGVAPKVGDTVMTPAGQGIVRMTYPDGRFGVDLAGGLRFSAWSASEITVLRFST